MSSRRRIRRSTSRPAGEPPRRGRSVRAARRRGAGDAQGARVGLDQGREDLDDRGLAGAVGAEQGEDRPLGDVEIDAVEDDVRAERLAQAGGQDRRSHGGHGRHGRRMTTLPTVVRARTSTVSVDGWGASAASSALCTLPAVERTSSLHRA
jgi:hypothetical protein